MKKVALFSPHGYVGSFLKEGLLKEKNLKLFEITRDRKEEQYMGNSYDILIYSAAATPVWNLSADIYVQDNVVTAMSMIDFCREHQVKRIIYLSTDSIYGQLNTDMVTEKAVMVNPDLYAITKYLAEKIIEESGISYYILRLPGVVGRVWRSSFIYTLMDKIRKNENINLYNADRDFNNILYIDDLVRFITILISYDVMDKNEVFLLGNTEKMKLGQLVSYIKELFHSVSCIHNIDTDQNRYFTLDVTKAVEYGYTSKKIIKIVDELFSLRNGEDDIS